MKGGYVKKKLKEGGVMMQKLRGGRLLKRKFQEDGVLRKLKEGRVTKKRPKADRMLKKKPKEGGILKNLLKEGGALKKNLKEGGGPKKKLKDSQGSITFEKILCPTSSPAFGSRSSLTVPAWFIKQHGDELRQSASITLAKLRKSSSTPDGGITHPPMTSAKATCSSSVSENSPSSTCTYTARQEAPTPRPLCQTPNLHEREPKRTNRGTRKRDKAILLAELLAKEHEITDYDASPNPPPFKTSGSPAPRQKLKDLPCFIKRIVASNLHDAAGYASGACLEVPHSFATEHDMQLGRSVKLRGFSDGSPVRVVACKSNAQRRQTRLHLRNGWSSFVSDNNLRLGQVLVITLTGYSSFVVKEQP